MERQVNKTTETNIKPTKHKGTNNKKQTRKENNKTNAA